jgi:hypothetical protein
VRGRGTGMSAVAVFELPTVAFCAARLVEVDARSSMREAAFATRAVRASVTLAAVPRVAPAGMSPGPPLDVPRDPPLHAAKLKLRTTNAARNTRIQPLSFPGDSSCGRLACGLRIS